LARERGITALQFQNLLGQEAGRLGVLFKNGNKSLRDMSAQLSVAGVRVAETSIGFKDAAGAVQSLTGALQAFSKNDVVDLSRFMLDPSSQLRQGLARLNISPLSNPLTGDVNNAKDLLPVSDIVNRITAKGLDPKKLGEVFGKEAAAILSKVIGVRIDNTSAVYGLKAINSDLSNSESPFFKAIQALGIDIDKSLSKDSRTVANIVRTVKQAGGTSEGFGAIQNSQAAQTLSKLLLLQDGMIERIQASVEATGGTAAETARRKQETLDGAINELTSNIEAVSLTVYGNLQPILVGIADSLTFFVQNVGAAATQLFSIVKSLGSGNIGQGLSSFAGLLLKLSPLLIGYKLLFGQLGNALSEKIAISIASV
ncbi:MAG: phage tail tape measure protein, partial [Planktothrix sp.]